MTDIKKRPRPRKKQTTMLSNEVPGQEADEMIKQTVKEFITGRNVSLSRSLPLFPMPNPVPNPSTNLKRGHGPPKPPPESAGRCPRLPEKVAFWQIVGCNLGIDSADPCRLACDCRSREPFGNKMDGSRI